jgi:hypothetical protein
MSQENVEIVRRAIASFNAGDMVAVAELFHPAAEWRDLSHAPDTPEVLVGVDAIIAAGGQWSQVFDEFSAEVYEYMSHPGFDGDFDLRETQGGSDRRRSRSWATTSAINGRRPRSRSGRPPRALDGRTRGRRRCVARSL